MSKDFSNFEPDLSIHDFIESEKNFDLDYYKKWGIQVYEHLDKCKNIILDLKNNNKKIVAFGAAAKGCIFLNALKLTDKEIEYIIDDTDLKIIQPEIFSLKGIFYWKFEMQLELDKMFVCNCEPLLLKKIYI